ncbi:uncharacterized protein QC764_708280 [Podospora pseudoanserina]|nr:hypothetical protein QC764_708280 [Podospora pseudoanserina]
MAEVKIGYGASKIGPTGYERHYWCVPDYGGVLLPAARIYRPPFTFLTSGFRSHNTLTTTTTMDSFTHIVRRGLDTGDNETTVDILIALLALTFCGLLAFSLLVLMRRMRRQKQMLDETLPQYHDVKKSGNHRRLTIETGNGRQSVIVFNNGASPMLANPRSPPHSPDNVPQIHITFPDEQDDQGRPKSGRVVVVRVGETTVGLEPLNDEQLPAYEKESSTQFYSVDIEKIGGLKEKEFR